MNIDDKMLKVRINARTHGKSVVNHLFDNYLSGQIKKNVEPICILCGIKYNLTKEHVLPKWAFDSNSQESFIMDANQLVQPYIKATLPACLSCNSDLLSSLERYIRKTLSDVDLKNRYYNAEEWQNIIRWLEIIDFKFQVFDISTKFRAHKKSGHVPYLANLSVAVLRDQSLSSVKSNARLALKRIATKNKDKKANSLVVAKTKNKEFHYFHQSGQFIFIEMPTYHKAFFYFYEREFNNEEIAKVEAMKIINSIY